MNYNPLSLFRNRSVFLKLLIVLFITAAIITTIAISLMGRNIFRLSRAFVDKFTTASVERFIDDLGETPTLEKAEAIREEFGIEIRFESKLKTWSTLPDFPSSSEIRFRRRHGDHDRRFPLKKGFIHTKMYLMIEKDDRKYLFSPIYVFTPHIILFINITTILIIILIFSVAYWILRKILKPIHTLQEGVIKVGEGHLDIQLPVLNKDELGQLTDHFNQMITRVKEMLHAKERLLLDVSHELRTPLTRMKIAMEFIPKGKHKTNINDDVNTLDGMLTELLESARLESSFGKLNLVHSNLLQMLQHVVTGLSSPVANIQLTCKQQNIFAEVDQMRLEIVLKNLINNAIKYAKDDLTIEIDMQKTANNVQITVADNGRGIPETELPFLFEPFYRVDKSRSKKTGGFGLGLSICKQIIEAHKGTIEIQSEQDKGTTVFISLPI
jgi:signal transduction histidine kinase